MTTTYAFNTNPFCGEGFLEKARMSFALNSLDKTTIHFFCRTEPVGGALFINCTTEKEISTNTNLLSDNSESISEFA